MADTPAGLLRFAACLPLTLAQECPLPDDWSNARNFSNDPHDPGGATMCGITQREYDSWRKAKGEHVRSVKLISRAEGEDIYQSAYWLPYCPQLPAGPDLCLFDAAVNQGTHQAIRILQVALGVADDGAWGPQTEAAVKSGFNVEVAIHAFTARRAAVYRQIANYRYFGADWERRAKQIGNAALQMASNQEKQNGNSQ